MPAELGGWLSEWALPHYRTSCVPNTGDFHPAHAYPFCLWSRLCNNCPLAYGALVADCIRRKSTDAHYVHILSPYILAPTAPGMSARHASGTRRRSQPSIWSKKYGLLCSSAQPCCMRSTIGPASWGCRELRLSTICARLKSVTFALCMNRHQCFFRQPTAL